MSTQDGLVVCLNTFFDLSGPGLEKSAEAQFMDRLTREHEDAELFSQKFVKLAGLLEQSPWELAYRVAFAYPDLEKSAAEGMPLAEYYVEWASDFEKRAFAGAIGKTIAKGWQGAKGLFKGAPKSKLPASQPMAGADDWSKAQANFAKMQPKAPAPKPPGSNIDVAAANKEKGFRSLKDIKKNPSGQAPTGGGGGGAPAGGAPAAGQPAGKGVNWGNVGHGALGGAAVLGTGALGYAGYKALKGNSGGGGQAYSGGYYGR